MLVMRTTKDPTDPIRKLISSQQPVELHDLALAVYPLRLDSVEPRTLLGQQAAHDPYSIAALLDFSVVFPEPAPDLLGDMPACVVPDQEQDLLASRLELFATPLKEPGRYAAHGTAIHEPDPCLFELRQIESVARDGLGLGIVFGDRPLDEAKGPTLLAPTVQGGQGYPAPPALVTEAHCPGVGVGRGHAHQ